MYTSDDFDAEETTLSDSHCNSAILAISLCLQSQCNTVASPQHILPPTPSMPHLGYWSHYMIQGLFAKAIDLPISPAYQMALQADGISSMDVAGEVLYLLS